jgi:hypothetical protein
MEINVGFALMLATLAGLSTGISLLQVSSRACSSWRLVYLCFEICRSSSHDERRRDF